MRKRMYWGLGVLVILLICGCVFLFEKYTDPERVLLKKPPLGETYTTGHWDGDKWIRTVPPDPETIYVDGIKYTYEELERANDESGWVVKQRIYGKHAVEKYPYSEVALQERYRRAEKDENNEYIWDAAILVPRYKEMLKWHSDSPRLLQDLAALLMDVSPAEAIKYGEEALKYIHLYPNTIYGYATYPEDIHATLGKAYQLVEEYDSALVHLKAAVKLIKANPGRASKMVDETGRYNAEDIYIKWIKRIKEGDPRFIVNLRIKDTCL